MSSPTDTSSPPPATPRTPRPRARRNRLRIWLVAIGALAFSGVLVYVLTRTPPFPTRDECLALGGAIESAKSVAQLQELFAPEAVLPPHLPASSSLRANADGLAAAVWQLRQETKYVCLGMRDPRTPDQRVLFRVLAPTALLDYHEYKLDRRDGKMRVVDVRLLSCDAWMSELAKEAHRLERILPAGTLRTLADAASAKDVTTARAIVDRLPAAARPSVYVDLLVLDAHRDGGVTAFRSALEEFRTAHADHAAPDMLVLWRAQPDLRATRLDEKLRRDAIGAVNRLEKRIDDDAIWKQLRRFFES